MVQMEPCSYSHLGIIILHLFSPNGSFPSLFLPGYVYSRNSATSQCVLLQAALVGMLCLLEIEPMGHGVLLLLIVCMVL